MKLDTILKSYYEEKLEALTERPMPQRQLHYTPGTSWQDVLGWAVTLAYGLFYFFGSQWGDLSLYFSFSPRIF